MAQHQLGHRSAVLYVQAKAREASPLFVLLRRLRSNRVGKALQGWRRLKKEALIQNDWPTIVELSNQRNAHSAAFLARQRAQMRNTSPFDRLRVTLVRAQVTPGRAQGDTGSAQGDTGSAHGDINAITASVNSVVEAWPPRSPVAVPSRTLRTRLRRSRAMRAARRSSMYESSAAGARSSPSGWRRFSRRGAGRSRAAPRPSPTSGLRFVVERQQHRLRAGDRAEELHHQDRRGSRRRD